MKNENKVNKKKQLCRPTVPNFFGDVSGNKEHFYLRLTVNCKQIDCDNVSLTARFPLCLFSARLRCKAISQKEDIQFLFHSVNGLKCKQHNSIFILFKEGKKLKLKNVLPHEFVILHNI